MKNGEDVSIQYHCDRCGRERSDNVQGLINHGRQTCCWKPMRIFNIDVTCHSAPLRCSLEQFQKEVHATAKKNGYHDNNPSVFACLVGINSEVHEAGLAACNDENKPDRDVPEFIEIEVELGDIIQRVLDMAEAHKLKVIDAMIAKAKYNKTRAKQAPPRQEINARHLKGIKERTARLRDLVGFCQNQENLNMLSGRPCGMCPENTLCRIIDHERSMQRKTK